MVNAGRLLAAAVNAAHGAGGGSKKRLGLAGVAHIVAVSSAKGGVGKSTTAGKKHSRRARIHLFRKKCMHANMRDMAHARHASAYHTMPCYGHACTYFHVVCMNSRMHAYTQASRQAHGLQAAHARVFRWVLFLTPPMPGRPALVVERKMCVIDAR